jgi:hypothetical protein
MVGPGVQVPEVMPQLSRGKHRNPRKGACFMEMASYLAGEKWSDHPACTHPLLAALARLVNDNTSDDRRNDLAGHIPSVVGLTSDDPRVHLDIMLLASATGLPVVAAERQRVLAVAILAGERALDALEGRPPGTLSARSREALDKVPDAARWARGFTCDVGADPVGVQKHGAPGAVRHAVVGISEACISDPDTMLHDLLVDAIAETRRRARPAEAVEVEPAPPAVMPAPPAVEPVLR